MLSLKRNLNLRRALKVLWKYSAIESLNVSLLGEIKGAIYATDEGPAAFFKFHFADSHRKALKL